MAFPTQAGQSIFDCLSRVQLDPSIDDPIGKRAARSIHPTIHRPRQSIIFELLLDSYLIAKLPDHDLWMAFRATDLTVGEPDRTGAGSGP